MTKHFNFALLTAALFAFQPISAQDDDGYAPSVFDVGLKSDKESDAVERDIVLMQVIHDGVRRNVAFALSEEDAPLTCQNFRSKVEEGYYNGLAIHRSIPGFIVQTGDPLTRNPAARSEWGTGGPGYTVPAEKGGKHSKGAIAMARLPVESNPTNASHGSQFYISLGKNSALDGRYTVFGQVVRGMDLITKIAKADTDANDNPIERIEIASIRIIEAGRRIPSTVDERILKEERAKERNRKGKTVPEDEKGRTTKFLEKFW